MFFIANYALKQGAQSPFHSKIAVEDLVPLPTRPQSVTPHSAGSAAGDDPPRIESGSGASTQG